jgi:2-C-methyl-D-erythritol 4-phosphate cytidylyltransferase
MHGLILTAAGSSTRFGGGGSKVLADLEGEPVIRRALAAFEAALEDLAVVVTARPEDEATFRALMPAARVVTGGDSRQASVALGLAALPADVGIVFVHDAARPLVTPGVIERVLAGAREGGAAAAVLPVRDTLHRMETAGSRSPTLAPGVDRGDLARAQTPQAARADLLRRAFEAAAADGFAGTDEVSLLLRAGIPVTAVAGTLTNIKITEPDDLELARLIVRGRSMGR